MDDKKIECPEVIEPKEKKCLINVPNFDDVDLGIIGIVILVVVGLIVGAFIVVALRNKVEPKDLVLTIPAIFAFGSAGITGIAALVRGLKRVQGD